MGRGLGWEKELVFKALARKLGDRLETQVQGKAGEHRLPGTLGEGVEGLHVPHSKWNVREGKSNCKRTCLGVYHSSMGSSLPLVLGKGGFGITRTFQRNLTFASLHH